MIGFIIGTFCLLALIRTLRHERGWGHHRGHGCGGGFRRGGYGYHQGGCGGFDHGPGFDCHGDDFEAAEGRRGWYGDDATGGDFGPPQRRGFGRGLGRGFFLRSIFSRLRTSPAQERVIRDAIDEVVAVRRNVRDELKGSRKDVSRVMRAESIDETLLGETFSRHDAVIDEMRKAVVGAMVKVHGVLDERQRGELADLIDRRFGFGWR